MSPAAPAPPAPPAPSAPQAPPASPSVAPPNGARPGPSADRVFGDDAPIPTRSDLGLPEVPPVPPQGTIRRRVPLFALVGALLFALFVVPAASSLLFAHGYHEWHNPLLERFAPRYERLVARCVARPRQTVVLTAGLIAAVADNQIGIAGVCPECTLRCVRLIRNDDKGIPVITFNSGTIEQSKSLGALMHIGQPEYVAGKAAGEQTGFGF